MEHDFGLPLETAARIEGVAQWTETDMFMTVNPTAPDKSFSVIAGFTNGHGCVLVPGKEFAPSFGGKEIVQ